MEISTVVGCKMRCSYCPQSKHVSRYAELKDDFVMSLETFETCLSKIPTNVIINFAGMAEPWLNQSCTDMVLKAHEKGHELAVFTTCVGMTLNDVDRMIGLPFRHFCMHLPDTDGLMKMTVTPEYLEVLKRCKAVFPMHNFTCIGRIHPLVQEAIGDQSDSTAALISRAGNIEPMAIMRKKGKLKCVSCGPKLDHNVLLPGGQVVLCCMDYSLKHVLGNLLTGTYADIFESAEYKKVMAGLNDGSIDTLCRTCEISSSDE